MTKAKHTPGPWRTLLDKERPDWRLVLAPEFGGLDVAHVPPWATHVDANARLIAAAPELLNALRLVEMIARGVGCATGESATLAPKTLEQIRAAIAKAEGRPPSSGGADPSRKGET